MPEEMEFDPREQHEMMEELRHEHLKHAQEEKQNDWLRWVSLSTAVLAVIAAIAALHSGQLVNEALLEQSRAVQLQAQASDKWAEFQAKSIKGNFTGQTADVLAFNPAATGVVEKYRKKEARYETEKKELEEKAREIEKERDEKNKMSGEFMHQHHTFAYCVTFTQVAIALSAIAALTRRKPIWFISMGVGLVGAFFMARGFLIH